MTQALTTPTATVDTDAVRRSMSTHDADGKDLFGWVVHRNTEDPGHVLITCDTSDNWLPGPAMRQAVARLMRAYTDTLRAAGFGTATWKFQGQDDVLIVAPTQDHADAIAPAIREHLSVLNPEPTA
jgi:hypothetical protein